MYVFFKRPSFCGAGYTIPEYTTVRLWRRVHVGREHVDARPVLILGRALVLAKSGYRLRR